ncbi:MAG: tetratricopeptide repeat protein [Planctomycetia bacterium]|nr:tetratricopeptide repeat protein [Planctomycetia bacterium]
MNPSDIRLDPFGFPIPPTFSDLAPTKGAAPETPAEAPRQQPTPPRRRAAKAVLLLLLFACLGMALVHAELPLPLGRSVADWLVGHAKEKYHEDDLPGALAALDRAIAWSDKSTAAFLLRGQIRLETGDLDGSVADFNKFVDLAPDSALPFMLRAQALQRQNRHDAAIRDMTQAVRLRRPLDPRPLNGRAYARAIAGVELDAALVDVKQALDLDRNNAAYLDTRGYIRYLRGEYTEALDDLEKAVKIAEADQPMPGFLAAAGDARQRKRVERIKRNYEHELAVMYHHRGEVHEKLGNPELARHDLRRGDELGYNREAGVY